LRNQPGASVVAAVGSILQRVDLTQHGEGWP
jgi:hypothetical protein